MTDPLILKARVQYTLNDTSIVLRVAYFASVSISTDGILLTVGDYMYGEAGNGWGAPFSSRNLTSGAEDTNLQPFFYPPDEVDQLSAGGLPSFEDQMEVLDQNATLVVHGFYWYTEDPLYNQTHITDIELLVTKNTNLQSVSNWTWPELDTVWNWNALQVVHWYFSQPNSRKFGICLSKIYANLVMKFSIGKE